VKKIFAMAALAASMLVATPALAQDEDMDTEQGTPSSSCIGGQLYLYDGRSGGYVTVEDQPVRCQMNNGQVVVKVWTDGGYEPYWRPYGYYDPYWRNFFAGLYYRSPVRYPSRFSYQGGYDNSYRDRRPTNGGSYGSPRIELRHNSSGGYSPGSSGNTGNYNPGYRDGARYTQPDYSANRNPWHNYRQEHGSSGQGYNNNYSRGGSNQNYRPVYRQHGRTGSTDTYTSSRREYRMSSGGNHYDSGRPAYRQPDRSSHSSGDVHYRNNGSGQSFRSRRR
jgi:hypothetical protein